jgi:hypothetical protein
MGETLVALWRAVETALVEVGRDVPRTCDGVVE